VQTWNGRDPTAPRISSRSRFQSSEAICNIELGDFEVPSVDEIRLEFELNKGETNKCSLSLVGNDSVTFSCYSLAYHIIMCCL